MKMKKLLHTHRGTMQIASGKSFFLGYSPRPCNEFRL